eukprot:jgi/Chlat1/2445/Chrsp171S02335
MAGGGSTSGGPPARTGRTGRTSIFATTPLPVGMMQLTANLQAQAARAAAAAAAAAAANNYYGHHQQQPVHLYSPSFTPGLPSAAGSVGAEALLRSMSTSTNPRTSTTDGGGTSEPSNSDDLDHEGGTADEAGDKLGTDPRKRRRMLANRESARRSRRRKQEHIDKLEILAAELRVENATLQKQATQYKQQLTAMTLECEDLQRQLRAQCGGSAAEARPPTSELVPGLVDNNAERWGSVATSPVIDNIVENVCQQEDELPEGNGRDTIESAFIDDDAGGG